MSNTRKIAAFLAGILTVVVAAGLFVLWMDSDSALPEASPTVRTETQNTPVPNIGIELPLVQLDGTWSAENNGTSFVATVSNETINIDIVTSDATMTYWNGTFKTSEAPGATVTSSVIDPNKMVLSGATSKHFVINETSLSFEFKAMGTTKTVVLSHA